MSKFRLPDLSAAMEVVRSLDPGMLEKVKDSIEDSQKVLAALTAYLTAYDARAKLQDSGTKGEWFSDTPQEYFDALSKLSDAEDAALANLRVVGRPLVERMNAK